ncbi:MAG: globin [Actinobacteria bacterium]|nr:globin [Actinomycetota bacterium]
MLFDVVGGQAFFDKVVEVFYDAVEHDPVLLPLYPEGSDTIGARHRLTLFLSQYWGGPTTYSDERGHPRLRMRHAPYVIGERERDRWLLHMVAAIEAATVSLPDEVRDAVRADFVAYVTNAAEHLRNQ